MCILAISDAGNRIVKRRFFNIALRQTSVFNERNLSISSSSYYTSQSTTKQLTLCARFSFFFTNSIYIHWLIYRLFVHLSIHLCALSVCILIHFYGTLSLSYILLCLPYQILLYTEVELHRVSEDTNFRKVTIFSFSIHITVLAEFCIM